MTLLQLHGKRLPVRKEHTDLPPWAIARSQALIGAVRDKDRREVSRLLRMPVPDLQTTAVALAAMVPDDRTPSELLAWNRTPSTRTQSTVVTIIAATADYYGLSMHDLLGPSRNRAHTLARQVAMFLCRELTDLSLPKLGETFARDHTTVMYAEQKIRRLIAEQAHPTADQVRELTDVIRSQANSARRAS